jgi:hypothetical protein
MQAQGTRIRILAVLLVILPCTTICGSHADAVPKGSDFVLAGVTVTGTENLTAEELLRGLELKAGSPVTMQALRQACDHLSRLRLFYSEKCSVRVDSRNLWIDLKVEPVAGPPLIFENFVWTTRKELLTRLKRELPLFTPEVPEDTALTSDIIRVLDKVVTERGIQGHVEVDRFWAQRGGGGYVFAIVGVKTPVVACVVQGESAPTEQQVAQAVPGCVRDNFETPLLNWIAEEIVGSLYASRGYLRPVVGEPIVEFLGEHDGTFPVRVVFPISPGPQYRFQSVSFGGIAKPHSAELNRKWKLKQGDIYDTAYISDFEFKSILGQPWAQHNATSGDTIHPCESIDESTKTVSLTLTVTAPKKWEKVSPEEQRSCGGGMMFFSFVGENFVTVPTGR